MILKSSIDKNIYKFKTLSNGLRLMLVSNPVFKTASCAVSVPVGSYDEPADFPGIAHFLEHMLFMGTEAYPSENTLDEFVSMHNGYSNAYTASETTVYYCCADSGHLKELNDIFANFFIKPIFNRSSVEREIEAVNSEYLNGLNSPGFRYEALLKEFMHRGIPESLFAIGNTDTLKHDSIWERVMEFWKETYTSHEMVAVIVGSDSIEKLEEYGQVYSRVPMRKSMDTTEAPAIKGGVGMENTHAFSSDAKSLFNSAFYQKLIHVKPLEDNSELRITFTTPPIPTMFKKNPIGFIESVLTSSEKGSLMSDLKQKRLGFDVSLEYSENYEFTLITIIISLTNQVNHTHINATQDASSTNSVLYDNISYILSLVLLHLNNLNICEDEYNRIRNLSLENFKFAPNESPMDLACTIAYSLQWYPQEYALFYNYSYEEYDYGMISAMLDYFKDYSKWIVVFLSNGMDTSTSAEEHGVESTPNSDGSYFNRIEKYFNVEYRVDETAMCIDHSSHALDHSSSKIDYKGELLCSDSLLRVFTSHEARANIDRNSGPTSSTPSNDGETVRLNNVEILPVFKVLDSGSIHYLFTDSFSTPHSEVHAILKSDMFFETEYSIFTRMVFNAFAEKHDRILKNYHICLSAAVLAGAIHIHVSGFANKIALMIEMFISEAQEVYESIVTDKPVNSMASLFDIAREELIDEKNSRISESPSSRLLEVLKNSCTVGLATTEQMLEEIKGISYEDMQSRLRSAGHDASCSSWSNYFTEIISVGNMLYSEVLRIFTIAADKHFVSMPPKIQYDFDQKEISFCTRDETNNAILMGFRALDGVDLRDQLRLGISASARNANSLKSIAIARLIGQICSEAFFNELRTKETLGYIVSAYTRAYLENEWVCFVVQSARSVEFLKNRIGRFLETFLYEKDCESSEESSSKIKDAPAESENDSLACNTGSESDSPSKLISLDLHKSSLVSFYREPFANIKDLDDFIFSQHVNKRIDLAYIKNMCDEIEKLEIDDILSSKIFERRIVVRSEKKSQ